MLDRLLDGLNRRATHQADIQRYIPPFAVGGFYLLDCSRCDPLAGVGPLRGHRMELHPLVASRAMGFVAAVLNFHDPGETSRVDSGIRPEIA